LLLASGAKGWAQFAAALGGLVVWLSLNQGSEMIMGLRMHPLFTATAAFALIPLLPLLADAKGRAVSVALSLVLAIGLAVAAGSQPAYSRFAPQRLNLRYIENEGKAWWLADPVAHLPQELRAVASFSQAPRRVVEVGYVAPAGAARYPAPSAVVTRLGDIVTLDIKAEGDGVMLDVPAEARLRAATVGGVTIDGNEKRVSIICGTPDCASARVILKLASSSPLALDLRAYRRGLPPEGAKLLAARPADAVPSQGGDRTVLAAKIAIPAR